MTAGDNFVGHWGPVDAGDQHGVFRRQVVGQFPFRYIWIVATRIYFYFVGIGADRAHGTIPIKGMAGNDGG